MKVFIFFVTFLAIHGVSASLKCTGCGKPEYNVLQILDLLELSKPIFADIKASSEKRIDSAEMYTRLSTEEQVAELEKDLEEYKKTFESNGHVPFPTDDYRQIGLVHIQATAAIEDEAERTKKNIEYFAARGSDLYGRVSKLRRPIMAELAGVSLAEWSSYLDDESKPIPFPLSCTLPQVLLSKAFRTKAAAELVAYGNAAKDLIDQCEPSKYNVEEILDLLDKSRPIFADIKASSEKRIDSAEMYTRLSTEEQIAELEKDLQEYKTTFESNGHVPFPTDEYRQIGLVHIQATAAIENEAERTKENIEYFAARGSDLYGRVSKLRRPIMAELAGVSLAEWSSYLDDESKPIPFPLSCTLPQVRLSKAFRTKAAAELVAYGNAAKDLIDQCEPSKYNVEKILDLLDKSRPIFAEIKRVSESRIVSADSSVSIEMLNSDIEFFKTTYESHGHIPFPVDIYKADAEAFIATNPDKNAAIDFFVQRGAKLYKEVSNIRRKIMSDLAGVTYEEWSSYLDDESKPIPFPLTCTLPYVRASKAFRTQAAADLKAFGEQYKN